MQRARAARTSLLAGGGSGTGTGSSSARCRPCSGGGRGRRRDRGAGGHGGVRRHGAGRRDWRVLRDASEPQPVEGSAAAAHAAAIVMRCASAATPLRPADGSDALDSRIAHRVRQERPTAVVPLELAAGSQRWARAVGEFLGAVHSESALTPLVLAGLCVRRGGLAAVLCGFFVLSLRVEGPDALSCLWTGDTRKHSARKQIEREAEIKGRKQINTARHVGGRQSG
jgi:hypothetical protein